jgi:hypothetical protein
MSEELDITKRYRVYARELRAIAGAQEHIDSREMLIEWAEEYDQKANALEDARSRIKRSRSTREAIMETKAVV